MARLLGDRGTHVLRQAGAVVVCALTVTACGSDPSYQEQALRASEGGDLKSATSLAQKEVEKYSASDQCSSTTNYNCGTLALALSSLAEYQILSGNVAAGERSFDRAKGALQRVPKDNKPSATGMVYRDVSEAFWKAGDKRRAIAVFREGTTRGADEWLYTSSAAKAVAEQEGRPAPASASSGAPGAPGARPAPGAPVPLGMPGSATPAGESDTMVKPTMVNDSAIGDPMRGLPPSSADPTAAPASQPSTPPAPSPLGPTPTPLQRSRY